jgi:hypothetical protein
MLSSGIIDINYILTIMKEIIEENKIECIEEIEEEIKNVSKRPFHVRVGSRLPRLVLNKLHLRYQTPRAWADYDLPDFRYNKMICLDFLAFCIENMRKLHFDISLFENEEDKKLVLRHVWNNIYIALSSRYLKKTQADLEYS